MARTIALTPAAIDNLHKGLVADLQTPGLAIEVLGSGKKRWRYRRRVARKCAIVTAYGGLFPFQSIADALDWARETKKLRQASIRAWLSAKRSSGRK